MKLNDLDLNKLRTFLVVHRAGSVRAAATALRLTPSAVSMALTGLERGLGLTLFARVGRRILPTADGDRVAATAARLFSQLEETVADLRSARGEVRGHLRIGMPSELGVAVVIPALAQLRQRHPGVSFAVTLCDQNVSVPALLDGRFDLAICDDGPHLSLPQLDARPLAREELVLVCSAGFDERRLEGRRTLAALSGAEHVAYVEHQADLHKWYRHHFGKTPRLSTSMVANHPAAVLAAVREGLGLGLLPTFLVEEGARRGRLRVIDTGRRPLVNEMAVVRLKEHVPTRAEQELLKLLSSAGPSRRRRRAGASS